MKTYELRWANGSKQTFLLPSDEAACRYAAGITERGVEVEIWADGSKLATAIGTRELLLPGAWEFKPEPPGKDRTDD